MASEWLKLSVDALKAKSGAAIAIGPFGSRMKADRYTATGVPVIRGNNLSDTREFVGEFVYVSPETAEELANCNVYPGDLVFPHRGAIGEVGIVPHHGAERYVLSTSLMKLTCNRELANPLFLFYFFRSPIGRHELLKNASTVGTPGIGQPLSSLKSIEVRLPPLPEQTAIARVLGTLDGKIDLNRHLNETLQGIARTLFKSWFVNFDPVRAKAEGRNAGVSSTLAALFPDSFDTAEVGEIPRGWQVRAVGDLATVSGGSTPSTTEKSYWEGGTHCWATPKDLSSLNTPVLLDTERKITDAGLAQIASGLLPAGTVLMSSRAPIGYLAVAEVPLAVNQGFIALRSAPGVSNLFLLRWAEWAHDLIVSRANGSTFLEISKSNFRPIPVTTPPDELMRAFDRIVRPLYSRMVTNELSSTTLTQLRNALLPKLISGELRVTDAERIVGRTM